jgi:hypothetical protein
MKPLFIPLKTIYFNKFADGTKTTELRAYGPRWNERTCIVGRAVTLSHGYGKHRRLQGVITAFQTAVVTATSIDSEWRQVYGDRTGLVACICIKLIAQI